MNFKKRLNFLAKVRLQKIRLSDSQIIEFPEKLKSGSQRMVSSLKPTTRICTRAEYGLHRADVFQGANFRMPLS